VPTIVTRAAWGANPLVTPASAIATPSPELWLHHTASTGLHGSSGMRQLQAGALAGGYVDLEYSYVVDNPTPTVFESRGPGRNTAATADHNERSHALCVMGNFETDRPSSMLLDVLAELVAWGNGAGYWPAAITGPHRDASGNATACCGRYLIEQIPEINRRAGSSSSSPPAGATGGGALLTTVASPQAGKPAGRTPTARPVPELGCILLENGAALRGDKASGANRVWTSTDAGVIAAGNRLVDIAATVDGNGRPDGAGVVALFDLGSNQVGTYRLEWS
jgi:hypothetical protein